MFYNHLRLLPSLGGYNSGTACEMDTRCRVVGVSGLSWCTQEELKAAGRQLSQLRPCTYTQTTSRLRFRAWLPGCLAACSRRLPATPNAGPGLGSAPLSCQPARVTIVAANHKRTHKAPWPITISLLATPSHTYPRSHTHPPIAPGPPRIVLTDVHILSRLPSRF